MVESSSSGPGGGPNIAAQLFLLPLIVASEAVAAQATGMAQLLASVCDRDAPEPLPEWTTPNATRLELTTMQLRSFPGSGVTPTLVCAPFALHGATLVDFAPGHSLVEALGTGGCGPVFVTDWRSADRDMRLLTLDGYLAELNVAVDEIGCPVDLVGLCQGGVLALIYAARFPGKVRRLVIAGAPIDVAAAPSLLALTAQSLPLGLFDELVKLGDGRVLGKRVIDLWGGAFQENDFEGALELPAGEPRLESLRRRFEAWYLRTLDLPGAYYHQTVLWLFKENRLAEGRLTALGRQIDLSSVRHPLFLLAGADDALIAPDQLLAARRLVGTPPGDIESLVVPGGHLGLFIGARTLATGWRRVARWLGQSSNT